MLFCKARNYCNKWFNKQKFKTSILFFDLFDSLIWFIYLLIGNKVTFFSERLLHYYTTKILSCCSFRKKPTVQRKNCFLNTILNCTNYGDGYVLIFGQFKKLSPKRYRLTILAILFTVAIENLLYHNPSKPSITQMYIYIKHQC